jgi:hypothetical protein
VMPAASSGRRNARTALSGEHHQEKQAERHEPAVPVALGRDQVGDPEVASPASYGEFQTQLPNR